MMKHILVRYTIKNKLILLLLKHYTPQYASSLTRCISNETYSSAQVDTDELCQCGQKINIVPCGQFL